MTNPLLAPFDAPFGLPPFAGLTDQDFAPGFDAALTDARARVAAIETEPGAPTFVNVIAALEVAESLLDRVAAIFYNLASADSNDARQALERDLAPKLAAFSSEVTMNPAIWARLSDLWDRRESLGLDAEEASGAIETLSDRTGLVIGDVA